MPSLSRSLALAFVLGSPLTLAGCDCSGDITGGRTCTTQSDCRDGEACVDGTCQAVEPGTDAGGGGGGPDGGEGGGFDAGGPNPGPCGDFDPFCEASDIGVGTDRPFAPGDEDVDSDGVGLDEEGALVLDSMRVNTNFIWIANTNSPSGERGQVVKVDTTTYEEVARYETGRDPSRTSVNSFGDVFVGNRAGNSVTKISTLGEACPDTNGDGVITTSAGAGDVLPFGEDDCMLWRTDLSGHGVIRAVAAQDVEGLDGELRSYVWVGGWNGTIWKLDGETGEILLQTPSPVSPYGFALDGSGNLWIASLGSRLGRLDTNRCIDNDSCNVSVCSAAAESADCDDAIKATISQPASNYGITVDFNQRVWTAGGRLNRYDPSAVPGSRWVDVNVGNSCQGIGADAVGFVYAACNGSSRVVRANADDPTDFRVLNTGPNRGIGIDADGKIWGILRHTRPTATVITPGATIDDNTLEVEVGPSLNSPYTYSDMTGLQLRLATNPRGHYRHLFEGCAADVETTWRELRFSVETPVGTSVSFNVRTADTRAELDAAPWTRVANVPPDASPISVETILAGEGITPGRYLMLEAILRADRLSPTEVISPRVLSMEVTHVCPPTIH